jgi:hypothetical protein
MGMRMKKSSGGKDTWYVRDANGSVMAIYEQESGQSNPQLEELPVYGSNRLGMYDETSGNYIYELKDHLGNVRNPTSSSFER